MFDTPWGVAIFIALIIWGALTALFIFTVFMFALTGHILRLAILTRTKKEKWTRGCPVKEPIQEKMYAEGVAWSEKNQQYKKDLHIVNEGYNLYGEYYDFGYDRAVIFVSGRTEALGYGYYFVQPYPEMGFNVLLIDQRAHGLSDGKYNCLGFDEHRDLIKWAELIHDEYGNKNIVLHGVCIGSSCCLQALVSENAPEYLGGLIADGMYTKFYESFKNHLVEFKQPSFPLMFFVNLSFKLATGHSMKRGNIDFIDKMTKPMLFIHSKEDAYSLPYMADELYAKLPHDNKKIVWYDHGKHSHLRPTDPEKYDAAVKEFLVEYFDNAVVAK